MGNLTDYIHWRGDLSFSTDPFNEVDNAALCLLSYVNFDRLLPLVGNSFLTLKELCSHFFDRYTEQELEQDKTSTGFAPFLMKEMAQSVRFQEILVGNYVNYIEPGRSLQMSAITVLLPDGTIFIAFRGTDNRILSWKEDFFLAAGEVSAQIEAVRYLNAVGRKYPEKQIRVGGHSKGGHMAVYAAANCDADIRERIVKIYNNDGPGFRSEFLESPEYKSVYDRIYRIIPEKSVVGMLLEDRSEPIIVKGTGKGIMQHNGMSWQVLGNRFERVDRLNDTSVTFDAAMTNWLENFDDD
ncbi:MAG: DUF2974 domain-containing protein [Eubacteriales bacterium]|nr:DUF2974 domain-containing protein [Eubacteriales bacterium]